MRMLAALSLALCACSHNGHAPAMPAATYGSAKAVHVASYGAIPNDGLDDTAAIASAITSLCDNDTLVLSQGVYDVSSACAVSVGDFGRSVGVISGKRNVSIHGDRSVIRTVCHDIAAHGGLTFLNATATKGLLVDGIDFDMSFTGCNTSSAAYPYCGAIVVSDQTATGNKLQSQLSSDIVIRNCTFKLFHPMGQFAVTTSPYCGDPNNGYKLFSIFLNGDYLASTYDTQNRNALIESCTWKEGHNGYGAWVWAFNNVAVRGLTAESWSGHGSLADGSIGATGLALFRYHQFHCSGVEVSGCSFRARPSQERSGAFCGSAVFCYLDTNLYGDFNHGLGLVSGNTIQLSNGDATHGFMDYGVEVGDFGSTVIANNAFDGTPALGNDYGACGIYGAFEPTGGNGCASLVIAGNTWGYRCSYQNSITISNSSGVDAYHRRLKSLVVSSNISMSQAQYFLDMTGNSPSAFAGVASCQIASNIVHGTYNTQWPSTSTSSRCFQLAASEASDIMELIGNEVTDKNWFAVAWQVNPLASVRCRNNRLVGVTTPFVGGSITNYQDP